MSFFCQFAYYLSNFEQEHTVSQKREWQLTFFGFSLCPGLWTGSCFHSPAHAPRASALDPVPGWEASRSRDPPAR